MNTNALRAIVVVAALAGSLSACGSASTPAATGTTTAVQSTTPVAGDATPGGATDGAGATGTQGTGSQGTGSQGAGAQGSNGSGTSAKGKGAASGVAAGSVTKGQVKGASGSLQDYLAKRVKTYHGADGCDFAAIVDKQIGSYAKGRYVAPGCGGEYALWVKGPNGWSDAVAAQEPPACDWLKANHPQLPASLGMLCEGGPERAADARPAGTVSGGSADLQAYLKTVKHDGGDSCPRDAKVTGQENGYAIVALTPHQCQGVPGDTMRSLAVRRGGSWSLIDMGQEELGCDTLKAKAPGVPTRLIPTCLDGQRNSIAWKPVK
ncbi:hypothetical protein [Arsenicicoccus dermatophilus]|uniref:hypothetical protein n=1 Tax=Arsenicicoccus dermatophilus TaxID=1076331 RepID=UPI003916D8D8